MYNSFSLVYDDFAYDIDYNKFFIYYEKIFKKFNIKPSLMLDICCGTGTLTTIMSKKYDMIGIDFSFEMLDIAQKKNTDGKILYLCQKMDNFELYGTVDACYSSLDSINYILEEKNLTNHFKLVHNYLNPDGIYIFDISTIYKFKNILSDNTFTDESENAFFVWQNDYDEKEKINSMYLDVFIKNDNGTYDRISETHYEKGYNVSYIKTIVKKCGFEVLGVYDEFKLSSYKKDSERVFFVLKAIKK